MRTLVSLAGLLSLEHDKNNKEVIPVE